MRPLDEFTKAGARDKVDLVDGLIGTNVVLCDTLFNFQCFRKRLKSQSYDLSPVPGSKLGIILLSRFYLQISYCITSYDLV